MNSMWRETFLLHSQTDEFRAKVKEADSIIEKALKQYKKPYVAFSGGKDSTCVVHLVLKHHPDIMVHHWDYGIYMTKQFENEVRENAKKMGVRNFRLETSELYYQGCDKPVWYKEFFGRVLPAYLKEGYDAVFVGLRKEESVKRKRRISNNKSLSKIREIWPLAEWTWMDVWSYIILMKLPYPSVYDVYGPVIGWDKVRFSTFFDPEFEKFGCPNIDGVLLWRHRNVNQKIL